VRARAVRLRRRRSQYLAVHPRFKDEEQCQLPGGPPSEVAASCLVLHVGIVVRVVKRVLSAVYSKKSAGYHPYFLLVITPCNELVTIQRSLQACLVIVTKALRGLVMITRLVKIITNTFVVTKLVTKLVMLQCGRCLRLHLRCGVSPRAIHTGEKKHQTGNCWILRLGL
jgi:hypothetical protein